MTELTQQAFDRLSELAKNAIKERDVAREALRLAVNAMRAPLDEWKGEVERKALDAAHAALNYSAEEPSQ